jgi:predicted PolB exonuclease-like 3'-5' exonuclease
MSCRYVIFDIETAPSELDWIPPENDPNKFPPLPAQRILVLSAMVLDINMGANEYKVPFFGPVGTPDDELSILRSFSRMMTDGRPTLVSWNGRGFDVPLFVLRAMRHGVSVPHLFSKDVNYRYTDAGHWDIADDTTLFGAAYRYKLGDVAQLFGLPGKMGIDGAKVWEYYKEGRLQEIVEYCNLDVLETACVAMRLLLTKGRSNTKIYKDVIQAILDAADRCAAPGGYLANALTKVDRSTLLLGDPDLPF